jgi:hypothetical protein
MEHYWISQHFFYCTLQGDAFPLELDNDVNDLKYYGVCDGAEILMNEVDVQARQRESQRLMEEQERKIVEQEHEVTAMQELQRKNKS